MNPALWTALGSAATLLLLLLGYVLAAWRIRSGARRAGDEDLARARADLAALQARVEELSAQLAHKDERSAGRTPATGLLLPSQDIVITSAGERPRPDLPQVPERAVLSVTVGTPLVKAAAFGHGLRRALSAESRNRIAFEMRREVKRARKARRRQARRTRVDESLRAEEAA